MGYLQKGLSFYLNFNVLKCVYIYLILSDKKEFSCLFTKPFFLNLRNQLLICNISNNCKSQLIEKLSVVTNFPLKLPSVVEFLYFTEKQNALNWCKINSKTISNNQNSAWINHFMWSFHFDLPIFNLCYQ